MNGSSYEAKRFDDMIEKPFQLCPICLRKLQHNMQFDVQERYKALYEFSDKISKQDESFIQIRDLYQNLLEKVEEKTTP